MNVFVRIIERDLNQKDTSASNSNHLSVTGATALDVSDGPACQPPHDVPYFRFVCLLLLKSLHSWLDI